MLGLLKPHDGHITVYGRKAGDKMTAANIGYVPQRSTSMKEFPATVEEIVRSGRVTRRGVFGRFTEADQEAVDEAIEKSGLADLRERNIAELSGGQRQRVYIARALASRPKLLILDEPTTGIDVKVQHSFFEFLRELNEKEGMTILLVSHDLDTVTHETKTIMCLNKTLVCNLPTCDFLASDHLENLFGSDNHGTHTTTEHTHK
jgi:zinc transport system ATP-binding protein